MTTRVYKLVFECCGNEVPLGLDSMVGHHGDWCLKCDTEDPETTVESEFL